MKKPKQFLVEIIIFIIGLIVAFLPLLGGIPSEVSSIAIPLICLGVFVVIYSFDWTKHSFGYKISKSLVGISVFENFHIDGVNVFDFWSENYEKTISIKCETRLWLQPKFEIVDYAASIVKVK